MIGLKLQIGLESASQGTSQIFAAIGFKDRSSHKISACTALMAFH